MNTRIRAFYVYLIFLSLIFTSCVADGAARFRGRVVSDAGEDLKKCVFELYRVENNRLARRFEIKGDFDLGLAISPISAEYYVLITCEGYSGYKSDVYELGGSKYMDNPINLGKIVLKRNMP